MSNLNVKTEKTTPRKLSGRSRKSTGTVVDQADMFSKETLIRTPAPSSLAMIPGPLADFLRERGLLTTDLKFRPRAEFMVEFRNNHSVASLADGHSIAIARVKDQVFFTVGEQPQKPKLH